MKPYENERVLKITEQLLAAIGEDPKREGLKRTPERMMKAYDFLTSGYRKNIKEVINQAIFHEKNQEMIIVQDIEVYSLCEHHLLPFFGKAHVAYIPNGKIIGISKIPRIVDMFARRLQVQERLTDQIAGEINRILDPKGVAIVIEAKHLCMMMRGIEKQNSSLTTSSMLGQFQDSQNTRMEFLSLIQK